MRLVQKSLMHTGYYILDDGQVVPSFSDDLVDEAMLSPHRSKIKKMFGTLSLGDVKYLLKEIRRFKNENGIIPQNLTEMLRTGFGSTGELKQSHNLFIYK